MASPHLLGPGALTLQPPRPAGDHDLVLPVEVSVVIPCLNEADTIGRCVQKALLALERTKIRGEVIVADNGSTDGSAELAAELGLGNDIVAPAPAGAWLYSGNGAAHPRNDGDQSIGNLQAHCAFSFTCVEQSGPRLERGGVPG